MPKHLFHIVNLSAWPLFTGIGAFHFVSGLAFYMHKVEGGWLSIIFGLLILTYSIFFWFYDIIDESTFSGFHTMAVRMGLRLGFLLFITSEVMLFFGFFWAFFHAALCPTIWVGVEFPPVGIKTLPVLEVPLFNTFLLIFSGVSITWCHSAIAANNFSEVIDSFLITFLLGFTFLFYQINEYIELSFDFSDSVYACSFFMLTGLHGMHVLLGVCFLIICMFRLIFRHFLLTHYLGLICAIWYWHFVDVVWIMLFGIVYCWGS